jgi:hypothetical protein
MLAENIITKDMAAVKILKVEKICNFSFIQAVQAILT